MSESVFDKIRAELLPGTLEFCHENVPYYRATWPEGWREIDGVAGLSALPLLDKARAIEVQEDLRSGVPPIPSPVLSSGTTRDGSEVLEVVHSQAELDASARFLEMNAGDAPEGAPARRELVVVNAHHGLPFERTSERRVLVPFLPHPNSVVQIQRLLERAFDDDERIEAMLISVGNLKTLTLWLLSQGVDPAGFEVRDIGTNSSPLSAPWRDRLEEIWDAQLWDNYSLSEMRTHACECEACGDFHFDHLPIVHELIDPRSGEVTDGPFGELVLSGLYPFAQAMPLVRYRTGDLVQVQRGCASGELGFTFLGRVHECVLAPGEALEPLYAPAPTLDILDDLASIARRPHLHEQLGMVPLGTVGAPWSTVTLEDDVVMVRARLRFHPGVFPEHTDRLEAELRRALLERFPGLSEETLEVELYPPPAAALTSPLDPELAS